MTRSKREKTLAAIDAVEAAPMLPHQMINRQWGKMPYAGGMGIRYIDEHDNAQQVAEKTAANLATLAATLQRVAEDARKMEADRGRYRDAVRGFGALLDMAAELQPARYIVTMRGANGGTDTETITVHPGQDAEEEAARAASGYGATVEKLQRI